MILVLRQNDTRRAIAAILKNPKKEFVKLTNSTVKFIMVDIYDKSILANREASIVDAENGKVIFSFIPEEVEKHTTAKAQFKVTYEDGSIETFPNSGHIDIIFEPDFSLGG